MVPVRLTTFGRPHIADADGHEVALQPLPVAVLAYLAAGGPRDRTHLADLFWHNSKNGLNSLSTTLNRIRAEVPDGIWVRGNTLVGTDLASDVGDLRDAVDRADVSSVAQLYVEPFLGSLKLRRKSAEFDEWVLETRTTLASMVELTLLRRGRELYNAGDYAGAATAAEGAWEIAIRDGFPSPDYFESYHQILATAARPSANAVRTMAAEFGLALAPVEPVAFDSVTPTSTPDDGSAMSSANGRSLASGTSTQLFGAQDELDAIASSVASQRFTTIVGLGGSGKTRLAAEFFNSSATQANFTHRHWVNLRDVADENLVAPAIAAAMGQRFSDITALAEQLPDDAPVLIVLDNFEHVLGAADIAQQLGNANDGVRILVTSRVPLQVAAESLVQLTGLAVADDELDSAAEQLFASSARRAGVGDDRLDDAHRTAIRDVCRRVGGNPLALEIAGGWAQVLSPTEILDALERSNELLGSPMVGDLRAMDVVLSQSWSTLPEADQRTLMLLATFPAGCLTKETLTMSELPIRSIGRLVQHSLVRLHVEGRITLHPLIASHALSELEQRADLQREFQQVLSDWCQRFAADVTVDTRTLDAEIANFASAWSWGAQQGVWDLHRSTIGPLRQFFTDAGRISEGRAMLAMLVEALQSDPDRPDDVLAAALEALAWLHLLSGDLGQASSLLDDALVLSDASRPHEHAQARRTIGIIQLTRGEIDEATQSFNVGLDLIDHEPGALGALLQFDLAQAQNYRGERDQARSTARLALQSGRASNDWGVMVRAYLLLADMEIESDPKRAIVLLNEGWDIAKEASLDQLAIFFPNNLGLAHINLGEVQLAEQYFAEGIQAADAVGQLATLAANHIGRAEARLLSEQIDDAAEDLKTGIRLALKTGAGRYLLWAAVVSCRASVVAGEPTTAARELLSLALRHPAADQDAQDKAAATLQELFGDAVHPESAATGEDFGLDEIAERSLELLTMQKSIARPG